jgi:hypothetical protein
MSNIKLDLKGFKFHSTDGKSTTLEHVKDGHKLTLYHNVLSPSNSTMLKSLSKLPQQYQTSSQAQEAQDQKPKYAEGTPSGGVKFGGTFQEVDEANAPKTATPSAPAVKAAPTPQATPATDTRLNGHNDSTLANQSQYESKLNADSKRDTGTNEAQRDAYGGRIHKANGGMTFNSSDTPMEFAKGGQIDKQKEFFKSEPGKQALNAANKVSQDVNIRGDNVKAGIPNKKAPVRIPGEHFSHGGSIGEAETCYACGGSVQHYADGTPPGGASPVAVQDSPVPTALQADAPVVASPDLAAVPTEFKADPNADQTRKRQLYNEREEMAGKNVSPEIAKAYNELLGTTKFGNNTFGPKGEAPVNFDAKNWQGAEQQYAQEQNDNAAQIAQQQQDIIAQNKARTSAGLAPLPVPNVPNGPQVPGSDSGPQSQDPAVNTLPKAPQDSDPYGMGAQQNMLRSGFNSKLAGIGAEAQAKGDLGQQQAEALQKSEQAQTQAKAAYQGTYNQLEQERQAHMEDIQNGHIDPNKYWTGDSEGNGGHSKIATGIGMILAGFNPTQAPNAAINFLKFNMEQNLQAQKENLNSKQNLLRANLEQFHNLKDATDMTRMMQNDIMQNELSQAAAKATNPLAKAAAQQAAGQLKMDAAPMFQQFAMRRAMMNLANSGNSDPQSIDHMLGYMRMTNPEMAKEMESRYIPGVGLGTVPVPEAVRSQLVAHNSLDTSGRDLLKYSQSHSNIVPGTPEYNFGVTKALAFQQAVRDGLLGTVFRESEKPLLDKFVKENPAGAFKAFTTQPQLKAILDSNAINLNQLKKSYGLPVQQQQQAQQNNSPQAAMQWAKANQNDPRAKEILRRLGQ